MKPQIILKFEDEEVKWWSNGWANDHELMAAAKKAITEGDNPDEVRANLTKTFEVTEID